MEAGMVFRAPDRQAVPCTDLSADGSLCSSVSDLRLWNFPSGSRKMFRTLLICGRAILVSAISRWRFSL